MQDISVFIVTVLGTLTTGWLAVCMLSLLRDSIFRMLRVHSLIIDWFFYRDAFKKWMQEQGGNNVRS